MLLLNDHVIESQAIKTHKITKAFQIQDEGVLWSICTPKIKLLCTICYGVFKSIY